MQVTGFIGGSVAPKTTQAGRTFYGFRLAEGFGRGENRETVWYDIAAFIPESVAYGLSKGDRVAVKGKPSVKLFKRGSGEQGASIQILAFEVEKLT